MTQAYVIDRFGDTDGLRLVDRPTPRPGPGEVVVRIHSTSLNYRDLIVLRGQYPGAATQLASGLVPLSDGAGEIVEIGERVNRVSVGDRVAPIFNQHWFGGPLKGARLGGDLGGAIDGVLARHVVLGQEGVVRLPDYLSYDEAAALPCAAVTAWSSLMCGTPLQPGETVLVQGTGGVSIFALQFARLFGARVIATTSSAARAERLTALGADAVIDYVKTPEWGAAARELTDGQGVDRIVEVGGAGTFQQTLACARRGGQIATVGLVSGMEGMINPLQILLGQVSVHGIAVGSRDQFEQMLDAMAVARLRPVVDRVFPFAQAADAYRHLEGRRHVGKVVVAVD